ncbi:MAG TPA: transglycosylase SLT domain-containing protein [Rhizomicrobium sp.]|nr:transglycosylase SLT domain-containing protein [Rhizomicrobium sp.]
MQAEAANATSSRSFVLGALQQAAQATGADFNYLLGTAMRESGLKPSAKAGTSSATGLFQFIEQTWLGVVKTYGARHGLASYANAISQGADGRFRTSNPADRSAILALRNDPQVASLMEGEFAQATRATLQNTLGRDVCGGELYAAHFLGPDAACRLIRMNETQPGMNAASAFPAAADANRTVFYRSDGTPKTVREVYNWALKQTSGTAALAGTAPKAASLPVVVDNGGADAADTNGLLLGIASWRPTHGFFSSDDSDGTPNSSILLSPAVMDVLQSIDTVPDSPAH